MKVNRCEYGGDILITLNCCIENNFFKATYNSRAHLLGRWTSGQKWPPEQTYRQLLGGSHHSAGLQEEYTVNDLNDSHERAYGCKEHKK
jgi:hypothetical protein